MLSPWHRCLWSHINDDEQHFTTRGDTHVKNRSVPNFDEISTQGDAFSPQEYSTNNCLLRIQKNIDHFRDTENLSDLLRIFVQVFEIL